MKLNRTFLSSVLLPLSILVASQSTVSAQETMSLTQMNCSTTDAVPGTSSWVPIDSEVTIGREVYTAVAALRRHTRFLGSSGTSRNHTAGVACRITPNGATPRYRTLRLAFGMTAENSNTDESDLIRLDVFVDGNQVESQEVTKWEPGYLSVDVSNARSVALEATCLSTGRRNTCPSLVFVQTLLEQ